MSRMPKPVPTTPEAANGPRYDTISDEILVQLVTMCHGYYFTLPTFNPALAAVWDRAKARVDSLKA